MELIPGDHLAQLQRLQRSEADRRFGAGEPDLFPYDDFRRFKFVEVKKGRDALRPSQLRCIAQIIRALRYEVDVVYVREAGQHYVPKTYVLDLGGGEDWTQSPDKPLPPDRLRRLLSTALAISKGDAMGQFGFAPAGPEDAVVYGAQRPGYRSERVDSPSVNGWISFVRNNGIRRVCCLLPAKQLAYYRVNLLETYRESFGAANVCHAPIEDYHLCDHRALEETILPFLEASDTTATPVVVHCSGGLGRTGHVLAAWLVRARGVSVDAALEMVSRERNPWEAVRCGYATEKELRCLLAGKGSGDG